MTTDLRARCPWCGSGRARPGPSRERLEYRICRDCGSGWLPSDALSYRDYYEDYDPAQVCGAPPILLARYDAMLAGLERVAPERSLLEVGCGNGHFLERARARGWSGAGLELSRAHVERARERGLDVRYGDLSEDALWAGRSFGAVVAIEVVEHVPRPRELLFACSQRLQEGGVLYLTTPNFGSITRRLLGADWSVLHPEHVALASARGLRRALADAGHRMVDLRSKNLYLSEYRAALRRRRSPDRPCSPPSTEVGAGEDAPAAAARVDATAELRDRIEGSRALRLLKGAANGLLRLTGLGEGLVCLSRKVSAPRGTP